MAKREHPIQAEIMLALGGLPDVRLWRNNSGQAWTGSRIDHLSGRRVLIHDARPIAFGVPGSSDLIGLFGPDGRFLGVEVKSQRGRLTEQQQKFGAMVQSLGGLYIVARSPGDALDAIAAARESVPAGRRLNPPRGVLK